MQSVRTRSENAGSQRFEPSIAHHLTPLRRGGEQASVAFSAFARTRRALNGLRCIASAEALRVRIASSQVFRQKCGSDSWLSAAWRLAAQSERPHFHCGRSTANRNRRWQWQRTDGSRLQLSLVMLRRTGASSLRILLTIASIRSAGTSISCNNASASAAADSASS